MPCHLSHAPARAVAAIEQPTPKQILNTAILKVDRLVPLLRLAGGLQLEHWTDGRLADEVNTQVISLVETGEEIAEAVRDLLEAAEVALDRANRRTAA